jgi:hypothetical protein
MRWAALLGGLLLVVIGVVWFLQGIGLLPGSFMTRSTFWAVAGAVVVIAGIWVLVGVARRRPPSRP